MNDVKAQASISREGIDGKGLSEFIELVRRSLDILPSQVVHLDDSLTETLGADSLAVVELFLEIEEVMQIKMPSTDVDGIDYGKFTVNELWALVRKIAQPRGDFG
jgi:acyl carrier protein